jgi:hypothetical protein
MRELYHATWWSNTASIEEKGLLPGIDGSVYLAGPQPGHAAQFLVFQTQWATDGEGAPIYHEVETDDGQKHRFPTAVENTHIYVYTVDVSRLDPDLLSPSSDHAPGFWLADTESYWYDGVIPPEHISLTYQFNLADIHSDQVAV